RPTPRRPSRFSRASAGDAGRRRTRQGGPPLTPAGRALSGPAPPAAADFVLVSRRVRPPHDPAWLPCRGGRSAVGSGFTTVWRRVRPPPEGLRFGLGTSPVRVRCLGKVKPS